MNASIIETMCQTDITLGKSIELLGEGLLSLKKQLTELEEKQRQSEKEIRNLKDILFIS